MSTPGWTWDAVRGKYYRFDHTSNCIVFEDGTSIPLGSQQPQSQPTNPYAATARTTVQGAGSSPQDDLERRMGGLGINQPSYGNQAHSGSSRAAAGVVQTPFNSTFDSTGDITTLDRTLFSQGVRANWRVGATPDRFFQRGLDPKYKIRRPGNQFYKRGKVFRILWPEPAGTGEGNSVYTSGAFNEPYYMKIRWFVVIREGKDFCSCLPIVTYNGQGVAKPSVQKDEHGIAFTDDEPDPLPAERPLYGERGMRPSVRVRQRGKAERLDNMSRLNYAKVYTVEHNVKVYEFGDVHKDSISQLLRNFKAVWNMDTTSAKDNIIREESDDDDDDDDEDPDDDAGDDDDNQDGPPRDMGPTTMTVHNHYVNHYVAAYRKNNLHNWADWLQNATHEQQVKHIQDAQKTTQSLGKQSSDKSKSDKPKRKK